MADWDRRFLNLARHVSTWSKDPSTKVGAVVTADRFVLGLGYNGFPPGCDDSPEIYADRPRKYRRVIHAEMNAMLNTMGKIGRTPNLHIYCTLFPCSACAAAMIQFGIKAVFSPEPTPEEIERWGDSFKESQEMFVEAGVDAVWVPD